MAKAPAKKIDEPVGDDAFRAKHEDTIGTPDVQNAPSEPVAVPDDDAGFTDPDDAELAAAEADAAEEAIGTKPVEPAPDGTPALVTQAPAPADGQQPAPQPEPAPNPEATPAAANQQPAQPDAGGDQSMVPHARFREVELQREALKEENQYLKGVADTHRVLIGAGVDPNAQPAPQAPQPTTQDRVAAIRAQKLDLATKYEAGEIAVAEWVAGTDVLEDQLFDIRTEALRQEQQPRQPDRRTQEDLYLQERSDQIMAEHPLVEKISDGDLNYLVGKARNELGYGARELNTAAEVLALRERVAVLSDTHGPIMLGEPAQPATPTPAPEPAPTPNQPGQMPETALQRQHKLNMAGQHPVDIQTAGNAATPNGTPSDAEIERMTDEEIIARLPDSTQNQVMQSRIGQVR